MSIEVFGHLPDGTEVQRVTIANGGLTAQVITWGAVVQDLRLAGHAPPLVLGFETLEPYLTHSPYFGALAGRYANRIRGGRFELDGAAVQADTNFLGKHLLHGGAGGIGKQVWRVADLAPDSVTLTLRSPDGQMGFPGNLDLTCRIAIAAPAVLALEITGVSDAPTLCNIAHHSYFNLNDGGRGGILDHEMRMDAGAYLPVDEELIPTGVVMPVEAAPAFDFRRMRRIGNAGHGAHRSYDHNFCLSAGRAPLREVARVRGDRSGVEMRVRTTEPGLQFYDGARVARDIPGLEGVLYGAYAGFCLEPQVWPDSPNRPYFPQAVLRPGETYGQVTEYRFAAAEQGGTGQ